MAFGGLLNSDKDNEVVRHGDEPNRKNTALYTVWPVQEQLRLNVVFPNAEGEEDGTHNSQATLGRTSYQKKKKSSFDPIERVARVRRPRVDFWIAQLKLGGASWSTS